MVRWEPTEGTPGTKPLTEAQDAMKAPTQRGRLALVAFYVVITITPLALLSMVYWLAGWRAVLGGGLMVMGFLVTLGWWSTRKEEKLDQTYPLQRLAQKLWKDGVETELSWHLAYQLMSFETIPASQSKLNPIPNAMAFYSQAMLYFSSPMGLADFLEAQMITTLPRSYGGALEALRARELEP